MVLIASGNVLTTDILILRNFGTDPKLLYNGEREGGVAGMTDRLEMVKAVGKKSG